MNHIARNFTAPDGNTYKSHAWELREGGYRRIAVIFGYPFWPIDKEKRLVSFLMNRGFRVHALEFDFSGLDRRRSKITAIRSAASSYVTSLQASSDMPVYLLVASFCALVAPAFREFKDLAAAAFIAPVLEYPPPGTVVPRFFFQPMAQLSVLPDSMSGKPELIAELLSDSRLVKIAKRDLRDLVSANPVSLVSGLGVPTAAFVGEEDPYISESLRTGLSSAGIKLYTYLRVRHAPAYDKYADNFYADLGSFLDEVEVGRGKKGA